MALEAISDLTISFLMANNPFVLVFKCFTWPFQLWHRDEDEDPLLSAPIPPLLTPQVKNNPKIPVRALESG